MTYSALPDQRIPYDADGTVVSYGSLVAGVQGNLNTTQMGYMQEKVFNVHSLSLDCGAASATLFFFFPEKRQITAVWAYLPTNDHFGDAYAHVVQQIAGSNDTTNGLDGTWEVATLGTPVNTIATAFDWRTTIRPVTFTEPKLAVRLTQPGEFRYIDYPTVHLYGHKGAGESPDDLLFIDTDAAAEFAAPEDFGDRSIGGTPGVKGFKIRNASGTKTASAIHLDCTDADFAISTSSSSGWAATYDIASLAPGADSVQLYVRCNPAGGVFEPRFARITASGYTFA